jgi:site-specific recombinase XerD
VRRYFASKLVGQKENLETIRHHLMGHPTVSNTDRYFKRLKNVLRSAVQRLENTKSSW